MLHYQTRCTYTAIVLAFCLSLWSSSVAAEATAKASVIVNASSNVGYLDINTARAIFTRKLTRWPDGQPVRVFVLEDNHPLHKYFVKQNLDLFPYQLRQIWDRLVFSGIGQAPQTVEGLEEMLKLVGSTPGAIGYAPAVDNTEEHGVRYVQLD